MSGRDLGASVRQRLLNQARIFTSGPTQTRPKLVTDPRMATWPGDRGNVHDESAIALILEQQSSAADIDG